MSNSLSLKLPCLLFKGKKESLAFISEANRVLIKFIYLFTYLFFKGLFLKKQEDGNWQ